MKIILLLLVAIIVVGGGAWIVSRSVRDPVPILPHELVSSSVNRKKEYGKTIENSEEFNVYINKNLPFSDLVTSQTPEKIKDTVKAYPAALLQDVCKNSERFDKLSDEGKLKVNKKFWDQSVADLRQELPAYPFEKINVHESALTLRSLKEIPEPMIRSCSIDKNSIASAVDGQDYFMEISYVLIGGSSTIRLKQFAVVQNGVIMPIASSMVEHLSGDAPLARIPAEKAGSLN